MSGFVTDTISRADALRMAAERLNFPWQIRTASVPIEAAAGRLTACDVINNAPYPPYTRSLRDGYAVHSSDTQAANTGTPMFFEKAKEIKMGEIPDFILSRGEAAPIPTGGILPEGADSVVMLEECDEAGGWVEVHASVQHGDNVIFKGEEKREGEVLIKRGTQIDARNIGMLAACGISSVCAADIKISVVSTGDEIVPVETQLLPPGCIRDINGSNIRTLLKEYGFDADYRGIMGDGEDFADNYSRLLDECDVLILSGGSSVGMRDRCSGAIEKYPGLLVRGINIAPGKPTIIGGNAHKLVVSLPGHPVSCVISAFVVLLPLLMKLIGAEHKFKSIILPLERDLSARTGPEEFIPCMLTAAGTVLPAPAKSGYFAALDGISGFIRMPEEKETARAGEKVEVLLWK